MSEAFNLIFQNFWTFSGTVILLSVGIHGLAACIAAIRD
jgi:hypothetical protein